MAKAQATELEYQHEARQILRDASIAHSACASEDGTWTITIARHQVRGEHRLAALMAAGRVNGVEITLSHGEDVKVYGRG